MTPQNFQDFFEFVVNEERGTMCKKALEYGEIDRLWNFKRGAAITGQTPRKTLWGYLGKHLTIISYICDDNAPINRNLLREKIGDARNYLVLLEALVLEEQSDI